MAAKVGIPIQIHRKGDGNRVSTRSTQALFRGIWWNTDHRLKLHQRSRVGILLVVEGRDVVIVWLVPSGK